MPIIHVVHSHTIDSQAGKTPRDSFRFLFGRKACLKAKVRGPKADSTTVIHKMTIFYPDETILSGGTLQPIRKVRNRIGHIVT